MTLDSQSRTMGLEKSWCPSTKFRRGSEPSAAGVTVALLSVADMADQSNVVFFSTKKMSFVYHPVTKLQSSLCAGTTCTRRTSRKPIPR